MSWRRGSELFVQMWPLIEKAIPDRDHRIDFTARLLEIFETDDMDPWRICTLMFGLRRPRQGSR
jgi:hypothetical protein